MKNVTDNKIMA